MIECKREGSLWEKRDLKKMYTQGKLSIMEIWVDKETGVQYLYHSAGYSGGMTPLLNAEGKPIITPLPENME
nr:DUF6440 family protein [Listeria ilorinensis]